jgi:cytochrome c-type biogenesis protein CcmF
MTAHPKKQQSFYKIHFKRKDGKEEFTLVPNSFVNYKGQEGLMSNPAARHYLTHDVFTYITSISNPDAKNDTASFKIHKIKTGDTVFYSSGYMVLQDVQSKDSLPEDIFGKEGSLHEMPVKIFSKTGSIFTVTSRLANAKNELIALPDTVASENLIIQVQKVNPDNSIELGVKESGSILKYITIKAYKFPFILILWFGVAITAFGMFISMFHRMRQNRRKEQPEQF